MTFDIRFVDEQEPGSEVGNAGLHGRITLGDYEEGFISLIGFWSPSDYRRHWQQAVARLVRTGRSSCLITSLHDPAESDVLIWWLLYPERRNVAVQNALLILKELSRPFTTSDPFSFIPRRRVRTQEGDEISEWTLPLEDFRMFVEGG